MKRTTIVLVAAILAASFGVCSVCTADEEAEARAAEQDGKLRDAVTHYVAALQNATEGSSDDQRLREKIIALAQRLDPKPAVPDEVVTCEGRAEAAISAAKSPEEFQDAMKEYKKALRLAPWVAANYFNLGLVQEKAGAPADAIRSLKLYLLAAPGAQDATSVKKKIAGLEYAMEKAQKEAAVKRQQERAAEDQRKTEADQRRADEQMAARLEGRWCVRPTQPPYNKYPYPVYSICANGASVDISEEGQCEVGDPRIRPVKNGPSWRCVVSGTKIEGPCVRNARLPYGQIHGTLTGFVSEDANQIDWSYELTEANGDRCQKEQYPLTRLK